MLTKIGSKRKTRNILVKIFKLFCIFIVTLAILFAIVLRQRLEKKNIINPVATIKHTNNQLLTTNNNIDVISQLLAQNNMQATSVGIGTDSAIIATLKNGPEVIFSPTKDITKQITSLQLIISHLTIEGKRFNRVDFRFDNPVIGM